MAAPTVATLTSGASGDDPEAKRAERRAGVDHGLASDPVRQPRRRHDRDQAQDRRRGQHLEEGAAGLCLTQAERVGEVEEDEVEDRGAAHEDEQARGEHPDVALLLEDVGTPRLCGDRQPGPTLARLGRRPLRDAQDDAQHRHELDNGDRHDRRPDVARRGRDGRQRKPENVAEDLEHPDHRAGQPDLFVRHEVRDVALERTAGDVRAESEQRDEGGDRNQRIGRRDADEEHHVEQRAEHDVRLAPAPAGRGVVADRADRGLHSDREHEHEDRDDGQRRALGAGCHEVVELDAGLDGSGDDRIDRGEAEPERRDADQGADRQVDARAGALGGGGFGDSEARDGLGHSVPLRRHPARRLRLPGWQCDASAAPVLRRARASRAITRS